MSMDFQRQLLRLQEFGLKVIGLYKVHLDPLLLVLVVAVLAFGLMVLFSAAGDQSHLFDAQFQRVLVAMAMLVVAAQLPPWPVFSLGTICIFSGTLSVVTGANGWG